MHAVILGVGEKMWRRPNIWGVLRMFHDITSGVGPCFPAADHLSFVSRFASLPSCFRYIGVEISPSGSGNEGHLDHPRD